MKYRNLSVIAKSYYGVTFLPGEVKEVPGYIHNRYFEKVTETNEEIKTSESVRSRKVSKKQIHQNNHTQTFKTSNEDNVFSDVNLLQSSEDVETSEETTTQVEPTNLKSEKSKEE